MGKLKPSGYVQTKRKNLKKCIEINCDHIASHSQLEKERKKYRKHLTKKCEKYKEKTKKITLCSTKCEKIKPSKYMKCTYKEFDKSDYKKIINKRYKCSRKHCHNKGKKSRTLKSGGSKNNIYFTHNNYDRPYRIEINGKTVKVYKIPKQNYLDKAKKNENFSKSDYSELVSKFKTEKIFIGKSSGIDKSKSVHNTSESHQYDGNTVLLQLSSSGNIYHYVSIDATLWKFTTDKDDPIEHYYSAVGPNDVSYPVALGKKNVYFMLDNVYIDRKLFPKDTDFEFVYDDFYRKGISWYREAFPKFFKRESTYQKTAQKMKNYKIIDESFYDYGYDHKLYGHFSNI